MKKCCIIKKKTNKTRKEKLEVEKINYIKIENLEHLRYTFRILVDHQSNKLPTWCKLRIQCNSLQISYIYEHAFDPEHEQLKFLLYIILANIYYFKFKS